MTRERIEEQARTLAHENREAEPGITKVYWFPDDKEVRLVGLLPNIPPSGENELYPFYFRASPADDLPAPSSVALIRPEEFGVLRLPKAWGEWDQAVELVEVGAR